MSSSYYVACRLSCPYIRKYVLPISIITPEMRCFTVESPMKAKLIQKLETSNIRKSCCSFAVFDVMHLFPPPIQQLTGFKNNVRGILFSFSYMNFANFFLFRPPCNSLSCNLISSIFYFAMVTYMDVCMLSVYPNNALKCCNNVAKCCNNLLEFWAYLSFGWNEFITLHLLSPLLLLY